MSIVAYVGVGCSLRLSLPPSCARLWPCTRGGGKVVAAKSIESYYEAICVVIVI